jgi:HAD superfamily hydrolase (TIGR01490 family)
MLDLKKKIAIFDIDGTIFRKNLAFELIYQLTWMKVFEKKVRSELVRYYNNWLEHIGVYDDYRQALVRIYGENIKGCRKEDVLQASQEIMAFHKDRTYIFADSLIQKLKSENYNIIAISGSPSEIVNEYNKYLQFDATFGCVYEVDEQGRYTGKIVFEPPIRKGEVANQYISENNLTLEDSYGIGDTQSDADFLELVENPIAFNPNQNLKDLAEEKGWRIVVEKKDVIYEINKK